MDVPITMPADGAPRGQASMGPDEPSHLGHIYARLDAVGAQVDAIETALAELQVDAGPAIAAIRELLSELRMAPAQGHAEHRAASAPTAGCTPVSMVDACLGAIRSALPVADRKASAVLQDLERMIQANGATPETTAGAHEAQPGAVRFSRESLRRCADALVNAARFFDEALGIKSVREDLKRGADSMVLRSLGCVALIIGVLAASVVVGTVATPAAGLACAYVLLALALPACGYTLFAGMEERLKGVRA